MDLLLLIQTYLVYVQLLSAKNDHITFKRKLIVTIVLTALYD